MTSYLRPGVFVEETLQALTDPTANGGESIAAFVGVSGKGGPVGPTFVTSWSNFQSLYGDLRGVTDELPYAVYQFFNNGGSRCYISRVVSTDATPSSVTLLSVADDPGTTGVDESVPSVTFTAKSSGAWGNNVYVTTSIAQDSTRFNLVVELRNSAGTEVLSREVFNDITMDTTSSRNAVAIINSPTVGSKYVTASFPVGYVDFTTNGNPLPLTVPLSGGTEGTALNLASGTDQATFLASITGLDVIDNNLIVNLPGVSEVGLLNDVLSWAQTARTRFVVIDVPQPTITDTAATTTTKATDFTTSLATTSYGAVYGPWNYIVDPSVGTAGALRLSAPGGAVIGQYIRTDATRGEAKAPAGTATVLNVVAPMVKFTDSQLDTLNQSSVNVLRTLPGVGTCIMGARTLNVGYTDRYINVRRALMHISSNLITATRYAIFEPNNQTLWNSLKSTCESWLMDYWQGGSLKGGTPTEAFYVKCDAEINDLNAVNAGNVNVEIGVAISSPAEFVVLKIGQFDGGTAVTENGV